METRSEEFSFTWQALKLLGKSLYSNPWAAISELVANGFDAGADNVFVVLDLSKGKAKATLEVLDNGTGMDVSGIRNYVQVGRNKRTEHSVTPGTPPMGRKGIGKLAALYLSDEYYLATKHAEGNSTWHLAIDAEQADDSKPELVSESAYEEFLTQSYWTQFETGTLVSVKNIDLRGSGEAALKALGNKLANQFLLSSMNERQISLCILETITDRIVFEPVAKQVAFGNYMMAYSNFKNPEDFPSELKQIENSEVKLKVGQTAKNFDVQTGKLVDISGAEAEAKISGTISVMNIHGQQISYPYELYGWIAVHATIDKDLALENDDRFVKNKFYNPSQIRLYVRNKLASENVLQLLGITQAYANYIEGEITFDLLDEDDLPDIATTNRQGFDENDPRIDRLQEILKPIVQSLIRKRESIMKALRQQDDEEKFDIQGRAKKAFLAELRTELDDAAIDSSISDELMIPIANKLSGANVTAKSTHRVFLSHASRDKDLLDMIYYSLLDKGVDEDEIFYTSKNANSSDTESYVQLKDLMKECITDAKTRILYVTSPAFGASMFCLFEGGAGWATRGIGSFDLLTTRYEAAPHFLHNGQVIQNLINAEKKLELSQNVYVALVSSLNHLVDHLNEGRVIKGRNDFIERFEDSSFPPPHELTESIRSYMDSTVTRMWDSYVRTVDEDERYSVSSV